MARAGVFDALVRMQKVVANLRTEAGFGFRLIFCRLLGFAFFFLKSGEARAEHFDRGGAILVLAALVLALHDNAGGEVREANRARSLIHMLATGAAGAKDIFANVFI